MPLDSSLARGNRAPSGSRPHAGDHRHRTFHAKEHLSEDSVPPPGATHPPAEPSSRRATARLTAQFAKTDSSLHQVEAHSEVIALPGRRVHQNAPRPQMQPVSRPLHTREDRSSPEYRAASADS